MSDPLPMLPISQDAADAVGGLSRYNLEFLNFVARNPEGLRRSSFSVLDEKTGFVKYPLQSWPLFVRHDLLEEMARVNQGLCALVKSIPGRLFHYDPAKLAAYYRLDSRYAELLVDLLKDTLYMEGLLARGDFVMSRGGIQCLELNMGSNLGGWKAGAWSRIYRRVPLINRFLQEASVQCSHRDAMPILFAHLLERARRKGIFEGELNVAFVIPVGNRSNQEVQDLAGSELRRLVREWTGTDRASLVVCDYADLTIRNGRLYAQDRRIHSLIEHHDGRVDPQVFRSLMTGTVDVLNGPVSAILADKRNLALLSELQATAAFTLEERALIQRHLPWTRAVGPGTISYLGEEIGLPDFLASARDRLVLKPADASQGVGVHVGCLVSRAEWDEAVVTALAREGTWVVQEYVESLPYPFHCCEEGYTDHDLVWGFLVFGATYGGCFLRMMPKGGRGVVNAARGASEGVVFEVAE